MSKEKKTKSISSIKKSLSMRLHPRGVKLIDYKNLFRVISFNLYFFFVLGLILHTSSNPQIFGKYTIKYFIILSILILLFTPFLKLINYTLKTSQIKLVNKKITLTPFKKIFVYFLILVFFIFLPLETFLRAKNIRYAKVPATLSITNFHPFLQHQLTPFVNKYNKEMHVNSYGFRAEEIQKEKPKEIYRIFLMGGSTVLNVAVPYEKNIARILEKMLTKQYPDKKIEVINAGNEGYTSEHTLIDYLFKVKDFNPDLIIVWHGINDMTYSCTPTYQSYGEYKPDYSHFLGALSQVMFERYQPKPLISVNLISGDFLLEFLQNNLYSDAMSLLNKNPKKRLLTKPIDKQFVSVVSYKRNMTSLAKNITSDNTKLILANQPYLYNQKLDKSVDWYMQGVCSDGKAHPTLASLITGINEFNQTTEEISKEQEISFINLESKIPKSLEYFVDDVHFTEKGNQLTAKILYEYIVNGSIMNH
ncbi:hypothetical protein C4577_00200 [Candidatus Parcubacteria bacterium]|nr:MAG: hypothetical protein C4577_00200 [Candidatus Parcubacteria bacterium]